MIQCKGRRYWSDYNQARWWFINVMNCGTHKIPGIKAEYKFEMLNNQDGFWDILRHFSADKTCKCEIIHFSQLQTRLFIYFVWWVFVLFRFPNVNTFISDVSCGRTIVAWSRNINKKYKYLISHFFDGVHCSIYQNCTPLPFFSSQGCYPPTSEHW